VLLWCRRGLAETEIPGVRVVGIEPLAAAASEARLKLDEVLEGRLEEIDLASAGVRNGQVDVIVLADVLEHMFDPWNALLKLGRS
jgi:2-polyprenyl-3-methyl-5-hydroxy-6-metoxy-1,4-benzoquinol methylase